MEERLLPSFVGEVGVDGFVPRRREFGDRRFEIRYVEGDVVQALAAARQEAVEEAVSVQRLEDLDLAATHRELEPPEPRRLLVAAVDEARAEHIGQQDDLVADVPRRNRNVVELEYVERKHVGQRSRTPSHDADTELWASVPDSTLVLMDMPPGRTVPVVSILLLAAGWVVIGLGWLGAGRQEIETGQIPYLISGGFGGAGLLLLGAAGLLFHAVQRSAWRRRQDTLELLEAVRELAERLERAPDDTSSDDLAPRRRTRKTTTRRKRSGAAT